MTEELKAMLLMCAFTPLLAIASATANAFIAGFNWGLGNRAEESNFPPWAVRLKRSHINLLENVSIFIGIVLAAHVLNVHDEYTVLAAWGFVVARLLFPIVYTLGITFLYIRTLLYFSSLCAMGVIVWRILKAYPL
jgi:uncharacterized MAPEG superfamily protein